MDEVGAFFVYGTLKKSFLRGGLWPRKPTRILTGTIQADLYDLGPYPAASSGENWILGEVWEFQPADMDATIAELDLIEGYMPSRNVNEYVRNIVMTEFVGPEAATGSRAAYAYFAGNSGRLEGARKIMPKLEFLARPVAAWPDATSRVPGSFSEE